MLNRAVAPDFKPIQGLHLIGPESIRFANGLQGFIFREPNLQLLRLEFVFNNVFDVEELPLRNTALSTMLKEGTTGLSSAEIAAHVDFYGAYLIPEYSFDHTSLTVYTMHKYVDNILPIVSDILRNSIFPQKELDTFTRNNKQSLQISLQKNDFIARRLFFQHVFGNNRYGAVPVSGTYDLITREDLMQLYRKQIQPENCTLFMAGNVDTAVLQSVERWFLAEWNGEAAVSSSGLQLAQPMGQTISESKADALQSAIRMGGLSVARAHPDFPALQFVNTLLGGFFGSRLMRNIREDKGYTYSIGSAISSLKYTGMFTLASEVGVEVTQATWTEIQKEFEILRQEQTAVEEVDLVRNYLQGVMLGSLESVFSHVDKFKAVYFSGLDLSYYTYYADTIADMSPTRVQDIAMQYFDFNSLIKVVVGKVER